MSSCSAIMPSCLTIRILAIDPGDAQSAYVVWDGSTLLRAVICPNDELTGLLKSGNGSIADQCCIEDIASYGMAVGKEIFRTCFWSGRFAEVWYLRTGTEATLVERRDVKLHHCYSARATDSNVRTALIDKFGKPGTKKAPNPVTFGLKSHLWAAFALATYMHDTLSAISRNDLPPFDGGVYEQRKEVPK